MPECTCTNLESLVPPTPAQRVYKEECTQCFACQDDEAGINVCLSCFNAGCDTHAALHAKIQYHNTVLNINRKEKAGGEEPPAKITKVAIGVDGGADSRQPEFEYTYEVRCLKCDATVDDSKVAAVVKGVKEAPSAAQAENVQAWELQLEPCVHTTGLVQVPDPPKYGAEAMHCSKCDLKENLWLCLTCGHVGCGRSNWDGTGGQGHGLEHGDQSGHPCVVKMGTITPEGTGDVYCYSCNDERTDPDLQKHLKYFGIDTETSERTEKTMAELNLDYNLKFDWAMVSEDGVPLKPVTGAGKTGLINFGNTCYLASAIQALFSVPAFRQRYFTDTPHAVTCQRSSPAECFRCQFEKMAHGILSGQYSRLKDPANPESGQVGITPRMFKAFTSTGHMEFGSMRQQDTHEFLQHLKQVISREEHKAKGEDPVSSFLYQTETRYQCTECNGIKLVKNKEEDLKLPVPVPPELLAEPTKKHDGTTYPAVTLEQLLANMKEPEIIQDHHCPKCNKKVAIIKTVSFDTFPDTLIVQVGRFFPDHSYVVRKLLVKAEIPNEVDFPEISAPGLGPDDVLLPEDSAASAAPAVPTPNAALMEQLLMMGIPAIRAEKGLLATGNGSAEAALEWVFSHSDDPDIDVPTPAPTAPSGGGGSEPAAVPSDLVDQLSAMGFTAKQATKALRQTSNNVERAVDWLFSHPDDDGSEDPPAATASTGGDSEMKDAESAVGRHGPAKYKLISYISHKGTSVHCGHYVAHVLVDGKWVLFNDNKVAERADDSSQHQGYVYFFQREDA